MTASTETVTKPARMNRTQEKALPDARRQLRQFTATEGDERQVWVGHHWFAFRYERRAWVLFAVESDKLVVKAAA